MLMKASYTSYMRGKYIAARLLEQLQSFLDEVPQIELLALGVVNGVAKVLVLLSVKVEYRQDLSVVRHQRLSHVIRARHQLLQDLQRYGNNLRVPSVECSYSVISLNTYS